MIRVLIAILVCLSSVQLYAMADTVIVKKIPEIRLYLSSERTPTIDIPHYTFTKDQDTLLIDNIETMRLVFRSYNPNKKGMYNTFLIKKGEKMVLEWTHEGVKVLNQKSTRLNEHNFFIELQKSVGDFEGTLTYINHKRKNVDSLLLKVNELYQKRITFLENYKVKSPMSPEYEKKLYRILKNRQRYDFLDHCNLTGIFSKDLMQNKEINDLIAPLFESAEEHDIYFLEALTFAVQLVWLEGNNYRSYYDSVKAKYRGNTRDYLLYKVLSISYRMPYMGELVDDYLANAQSEILKKNISDEYGHYGGTGLEIISPLYDSTKESLLYNLKTGEFISWDKVITTGNLLYIDFWATWCGGCLVNLPHTKKVSNWITTKGGKVIYISIDKNVGAWAKKSRKELLPNEDSYLLLDSDQTLISEKYSIDGLPRYMIVDKNGNIINDNAWPPNSDILKTELEKQLR